jgi:DNA-binding IclR family transcriptional regulator
MSGLDRFIMVLRLFDEQATVWTVPAMAEALGIPQSTIYRTVRGLLASGMLEMASDGRYRLGPAFIAFDRLIRLTDPLIEAGRDVLGELAADARVPCVALLSRLYNDTVMCVTEQAAAGVTLLRERHLKSFSLICRGDAWHGFLPGWKRHRASPYNQARRNFVRNSPKYESAAMPSRMVKSTAG